MGRAAAYVLKNHWEGRLYLLQYTFFPGLRGSQCFGIAWDIFERMGQSKGRRSQSELTALKLLELA